VYCKYCRTGYVKNATRTKKHLVSCSKTPSYTRVKTTNPVTAGSEAASETSTSAMVLLLRINRSCSFYTKYASRFRNYEEKFQYTEHSTYSPKKAD
jgi:hypothetical protein